MKILLTAWKGSSIPTYLMNILVHNTQYFDKIVIYTDNSNLFQELKDNSIIDIVSISSLNEYIKNLLKLNKSEIKVLEGLSGGQICDMVTYFGRQHLNITETVIKADIGFIFSDYVMVELAYKLPDYCTFYFSRAKGYYPNNNFDGYYNPKLTVITKDLSENIIDYLKSRFRTYDDVYTHFGPRTINFHMSTLNAVELPYNTNEVDYTTLTPNYEMSKISNSLGFFYCNTTCRRFGYELTYVDLSKFKYYNKINLHFNLIKPGIAYERT